MIPPRLNEQGNQLSSIPLSFGNDLAMIVIQRWTRRSAVNFQNKRKLWSRQVHTVAHTVEINCSFVSGGLPGLKQWPRSLERKPRLDQMFEGMEQYPRTIVPKSVPTRCPNSLLFELAVRNFLSIQSSSSSPPLCQIFLFEKSFKKFDRWRRIAR